MGYGVLGSSPCCWEIWGDAHTTWLPGHVSQEWEAHRDPLRAPQHLPECLQLALLRQQRGFLVWKLLSLGLHRDKCHLGGRNAESSGCHLLEKKSAWKKALCARATNTGGTLLPCRALHQGDWRVTAMLRLSQAPTPCRSHSELPKSSPRAPGSHRAPSPGQSPHPSCPTLG